MKIIEAPNLYIPAADEVSVFLAGGISNCPDWQSEVIALLENFDSTNRDSKLVVYNPRRANFDVNDKSASVNQITWEFMYLERCDIFSMLFVKSESPQPICFYELGRNLQRHMSVVSVETGFSRGFDVFAQIDLATRGELKVGLVYDGNYRIHAEKIYQAYRTIALMKAKEKAVI